MEAVRLVRFSGPADQAAVALDALAGLGLAAAPMASRGDPADSWIEVRLPLSSGAGDIDQVLESTVRMLGRAQTDYRLREHVTVVER